ncbi:glycosyltransferase [Pseudonocardia oroxyli]|uniref:Glycosyltransferase, catalytic subunit of cellulose synthase and poly-beta-1,6-N-acetylglucosamine synthase n=1 Tax=Pseudonocardia oroxyli TaxID=366584 RepID=A0A1G7Z840_PSEOR|nr:glycosyltransferase family 2 protein [Pseudonocardia oroxyli]SDH04765.1 Glycosyltransferase, catalytic subunit of cellulose synthase and poly-beta-1,6-N-acetylglucosamine synthase [Pseudonocardia oroxyli]
MPSMPTWLLVLLIMGVNLTLWGGLGIVRLLDEAHVRVRLGRRASTGWGDSEEPRKLLPRRGGGIGAADIAVLVPAHNESAVIGAALESLRAHFPATNIHVVSDNSSDDTEEIARSYGARVVATPSGRGKAGALAFGVEHFGLLDAFEAVMIIDADTRLTEGYLHAALPLLDDPDVAVVAGCAETDWETTKTFSPGRIVIAHRSRLYAVVQRFVKYGQAGRLVNAVQIVPGFASIYRTRALRHIRVDPPGVAIEDFHMTFEIYRQRLGRVGFSTRAVARTQDPDSLRDYIKQTRRWSLGFWQTVRRYRGRPDVFAWGVAVLIVELVISSVIMLATGLGALFLLLAEAAPSLDLIAPFFDLHSWVVAHFSLTVFAMGILLPDLILTVVVAAVERRALYLLYALFFLPMRMIDSAVILWALGASWLTRSSGVWTSPTRRATPPGSVVATAVPAPRAPTEIQVGKA